MTENGSSVENTDRFLQFKNNFVQVAIRPWDVTIMSPKQTEIQIITKQFDVQKEVCLVILQQRDVCWTWFNQRSHNGRSSVMVLCSGTTLFKLEAAGVTHISVLLPSDGCTDLIKWRWKLCYKLLLMTDNRRKHPLISSSPQLTADCFTGIITTLHLYLWCQSKCVYWL